MAVPSYHAVVVRTRAVTPRMQRVTVGGPGLEGFASRGVPDERVKLLLPQPGQERPALPVVDERGFGFAPGEERPTMRSFTLRRFDPATLELDLDFVTHDGHASAWARAARAGDAVGIMGPAGGYEPGAGARHHLLAGDETALPAIATILASLPAGTRADVLVEVCRCERGAAARRPGRRARELAAPQRRRAADRCPARRGGAHAGVAGGSGPCLGGRGVARDARAPPVPSGGAGGPARASGGHRPLARSAHVRRGERGSQNGGAGRSAPRAPATTSSKSSRYDFGVVGCPHIET